MPTAQSLQQLKEQLCKRENLSEKECESALLPSLEHASLVHSHLHHQSIGGVAVVTGGVEAAAVAATPADEAAATFDQTRNAIIYISLVVVVYIIVIMWLVSSNFRSAAATAAASVSGSSSGLTRYIGQLAGRARKSTNWALSGNRNYYNKRDFSSQSGKSELLQECYEDEYFEDDEDDDEDPDMLGEEDLIEDLVYFEDITETEALLVVQDEKGRKKPRCTTHFEEEFEGDPV